MNTGMSADSERRELRTSEIGPKSRERYGVIGLGLLIVATIGIYLVLRSSALESNGGGGGLLPYQSLVHDLVSSDQTTFAEMHRQLAEIEKARATAGRWPDASSVTLPPYNWSTTRQGFFLNYLAKPHDDVSAAAWLLLVQEPDPLATPDPAPNDETHHRLPDGTVLHVSVWTHRFGGQVPNEFFRQPEAAGWTQVLYAPVPVVNPTKPATR